MNWSVLLLCIASAFGAWHWWTTEREVARLPGILVSDEPLRRDVWLVDIRGPGGFSWNTSLRRDDTGNGACEIVYVEELEVR
jgi:hypothetical protein